MSQENLNPASEGARDVFLIAGLGNPGREYQKNRHNAGFLFANRLAEHLGVAFKRVEMKSLVVKARHAGAQVVIAKPQTYMNLSGGALASLARFYKVPADCMLVVYDDVDLPFGSLRMRPGGGSGGHNGMRSIIQSLGTEEFPRLRVGIGRPPGRRAAANYVLRDFSGDELITLAEVLDHALKAVLTYIETGIEPAMTLCNTTREA